MLKNFETINDSNISCLVLYLTMRKIEEPFWSPTHQPIHPPTKSPIQTTHAIGASWIKFVNGRRREKSYLFRAREFAIKIEFLDGKKYYNPHSFRLRAPWRFLRSLLEVTFYRSFRSWNSIFLMLSFSLILTRAFVESQISSLSKNKVLWTLS